MIPMKLKITPQEVIVEGRRKTVYVLKLDVPYSLSEIMSLKEKAKGQLVSPPPEVEAPPEDLFPMEEEEEDEKEKREREKREYEEEELRKAREEYEQQRLL